MIDLLNARNIHERFLSRSFADSTYSMSFYESVAVFEKMEWIDGISNALTIPNRMELLIYQISNYKKILESELTHSKIFIFGAGKYGADVCNALKNLNITIDYYIDNDRSKHVSCKNNIKIISPELSFTMPGKYIIALKNQDTADRIFNQLKAMGIAEENIWGVFLA
ncbi:MAG: hypothetical protein LBI42_01920 [Chitinispirillales bacterium]|jgi:hypothetical protein|nr:hypothetical protein [Chitinispirillales bacterium]